MCVCIYTSSMEKILERYERYSYAERQLASNNPDSVVCVYICKFYFFRLLSPCLPKYSWPCSVLQGDWTLEYVKLKAKIELLQKNHRQYMGEDLDSMNLRDLQNLEQQLDTSLKHIRTRKVY